MRIDVHTADDIGARKEQQDSLGFTTLDDEAGSTLIVLADGVGGQTGGAVASRLVVDCVLEAAREGAFNDPAKQREALREALFEANRRLAERMTAEPQLEGMATTLVAAIVSPEAVRWVSVGDSHLYLLRGGALRKLNEDHSYAAMLVKAGTYRADDPELDQYRSVITSAVSGEEIKHVDLPEAATPLQPGDIVLAASDGLDTLPENHVEALLYEKRDGSAQDMADALLTAVKRAGNPSQDNVSVVIARVAGKAETTASLPPVHDATTQRQRAASPPARDGAAGREGDDPDRAAAPEAPEASGVREREADGESSGKAAPRAGRSEAESGGKRRGNWALGALVAMALLGGGAYWVLSSFVEHPGRGPAGVFQSLQGSRPAAGLRAKRHECVTSQRFGFWRGRQDCEPYMGEEGYGPYRRFR